MHTALRWHTHAQGRRAGLNDPLSLSDCYKKQLCLPSWLNCIMSVMSPFFLPTIKSGASRQRRRAPVGRLWYMQKRGGEEWKQEHKGEEHWTGWTTKWCIRQEETRILYTHMDKLPHIFKDGSEFKCFLQQVSHVGAHHFHSRMIVAAGADSFAVMLLELLLTWAHLHSSTSNGC